MAETFWGMVTPNRMLLLRWLAAVSNAINECLCILARFCKTLRLVSSTLHQFHPTTERAGRRQQGKITR
jgi:hypothetical protein